MGTLCWEWTERSGGASRDRTGDLYNAIVALSQLSYGPNVARAWQSRDRVFDGQATIAPIRAPAEPAARAETCDKSQTMLRNLATAQRRH
jgi:hypothetical protein